MLTFKSGSVSEVVTVDRRTKGAHGGSGRTGFATHMRRVFGRHNRKPQDVLDTIFLNWKRAMQSNVSSILLFAQAQSSRILAHGLYLHEVVSGHADSRVVGVYVHGRQKSYATLLSTLRVGDVLQQAYLAAQRTSMNMSMDGLGSSGSRIGGMIVLHCQITG